MTTTQTHDRVRQLRVWTRKHGWVRSVGRASRLVSSTLDAVVAGGTLHEAAERSVCGVIDRAERMGQNAEMN